MHGFYSSWASSFSVMLLGKLQGVSRGVDYQGKV